MTIATIDEHQIDTRSKACSLVIEGLDSLREGLIMYHGLGIATKEIHADLTAAGWDKSLPTLKRYYSDMRKEGILPPVEPRGMHKTRIISDPKSVENSESVENYEEDIEKVNVKVHEPAAAAVQRPFAPAETAAPVSVPAVKRPSKPKDLQMLDGQQRKINERLLPIAKQLMDLLGQVKEEKDRLHGRWVKDNIVFATGFQRCADYWNECNYFTEFAEVLDDDRIKTYSDVLATIEKRAIRITQHMYAIQYATGCTPDPNKKDL